MADISGLPPGAVLLSPGNVQAAAPAPQPAAVSGLPPGATLLSAGNVPAPASAAPQPGFFDRVANDYRNNASNLGNQVANNNMEDQKFDTGATDPRNLIATAGTLGANVAAPIVEGVKSAINYTPQDVKDMVSKIIQSGPVQSVVQPVMGAANAVGQGYQQFSQDNPKIAGALNDTGQVAGNMLNASMIPGEGVAGIVKNVVAPVGDAALDAAKGLNNALGDTIKPTQEELKATSQSNYKAVENSGAAFPQTLPESVLDQAAQDLPQTAKGKAAFGQSDYGDLIDRLQVYRGSPLTLPEATELDKNLGDFIFNEGSSEIGKLNPDGVKALQIQQNLRGAMMDAANKGQVLGDDGGVQALQDATKDWAAQRQMSDIQRIVDKGNSMDNSATSIKNGFKNLANSNRINMFAPDVQQAIQGVANGGAIQNFFRTGPGSRLLGMVGGAAGGGLPGAVVGFAASGAARDAAGAMQQSQIDKVMDAIAGHSSTPPMTVNQPVNPVSQWFPSAPEPAPQLALPAPASDMVAAPGAAPAPATPEAQAAANAQRQDYASKGLTPDILAVQARNELKSRFGPAWDQFDAQTQQQMESQVAQAWAQHSQANLQQDIQSSVGNAADVSNIQGQPVSPVASALMKAMQEFNAKKGLQGAAK